MKKLILLVCFLLVSSQGFSQLYTENFSYTLGENLTSQTGWGATSGGGVLPINIVAGLSFPNYSGSNIGNAAFLPAAPLASGSGEDDTCRFLNSANTDTVYVSFMVNVQTGRTGDYFFSLMNQSGSPTDFKGRVFARDVAGSIAFGLSKSASTAEAYTAAVYSASTTYLVILKYHFVAGTSNDQVSLFVYTSADEVPVTEPAVPTLGPFSTGTDITSNIGKVLLRQGTFTSAPTLTVDGIIAETSWNNAVLPVELASFTSTVSNRDVTLNWSTASELNNSGFEIERSSNSEWTKVGNVNGNGTSSSVNNYSYADRGLATGSYSYRLKQIDFNGNFEYFNLNNEVNIGTPSAYALSQNYPNPFNPSTTINFDLPTDGNVSLKLYDMSGKEVATLVNEVRSAGYYSVNFNASQLTSGVYFYTIAADNFTATKKMLLVK